MMKCFECKRLIQPGEKYKKILIERNPSYGKYSPNFTAPHGPEYRNWHDECFIAFEKFQNLRRRAMFPRGADILLYRLLEIAQLQELNYAETLEFVVNHALEVNAELQKEIERAEFNRPRAVFIPNPDFILSPAEVSKQIEEWLKDARTNKISINCPICGEIH
jgi:hypothetical protein